jgi:hypothetical protein
MLTVIILSDVYSGWCNRGPYAERTYMLIFVIPLNVVMLNIAMLSVVLLSIIILSVVILNVTSPHQERSQLPRLSVTRKLTKI